jgi:iron-sulfur cluster assembly accessory protein
MSTSVATELPSADTQTPLPIIVTEKAANAVRRFMADQLQALSQQPAGDKPVPEKLYLRLRIIGGGCSGFQNKLELDDNVSDRDEVFEFHGVPVAVDRRSLMYLQGATVDYFDDLTRSGFSISNPSAKSHCGCGSSFSM